MKTQFKINSHVRTPSGAIERVVKASKYRVLTFESAKRNEQYHPSEVFLVEDKRE
jgi:hypothetical protein